MIKRQKQSKLLRKRKAEDTNEMDKGTTLAGAIRDFCKDEGKEAALDKLSIWRDSLEEMQEIALDANSQEAIRCLLGQITSSIGELVSPAQE